MREDMLAAEETQRKALMQTTQEDNSKMQEEMAKLTAEREKFEKVASPRALTLTRRKPARDLLPVTLPC